MFVACLLKLLRKEVSDTVTSTSDLYRLPGLCMDSKLPRRQKCQTFYLAILFNIQRTLWVFFIKEYSRFRWVDSNHQPFAYQAPALTNCATPEYLDLVLELVTGIEPIISCLQNKCNTYYAIPAHCVYLFIFSLWPEKFLTKYLRQEKDSNFQPSP